MAYVVKYKKGIKFKSGGKSRGGCLRTKGGRVHVFEKKATAKKTLEHWAGKHAKKGTKLTKKQIMNRVAIKKI